ncbi:MAG TPA: hypothetical protein PLH64_09540 [Anaerolineaceae bacterium]|nr:hypothetical protein [Anaerolineaceae bacterium]
MKRLRIILVTTLFLFVTLPVMAQSGGPYNLEWNTIDGGGGSLSTGGTYSVSGTAGQPDAGVMSGGEFSLAGGFWGGGVVTITQMHLYLPLILR